MSSTHSLSYPTWFIVFVKVCLGLEDCRKATLQVVFALSRLMKVISPYFVEVNTTLKPRRIRSIPCDFVAGSVDITVVPSLHYRTGPESSRWRPWSNRRLTA